MRKEEEIKELVKMRIAHMEDCSSSMKRRR